MPANAGEPRIAPARNARIGSTRQLLPRGPFANPRAILAMDILKNSDRALRALQTDRLLFGKTKPRSKKTNARRTLSAVRMRK
jgi:hypothetical protein